MKLFEIIEDAGVRNRMRDYLLEEADNIVSEVPSLETTVDLLLARLSQVPFNRNLFTVKESSQDDFTLLHRQQGADEKLPKGVSRCYLSKCINQSWCVAQFTAPQASSLRNKRAEFAEIPVVDTLWRLFQMTQSVYYERTVRLTIDENRPIRPKSGEFVLQGSSSAWKPIQGMTRSKQIPYWGVVFYLWGFYTGPGCTECHESDSRLALAVWGDYYDITGVGWFAGQLLDEAGTPLSYF